MGKKKREEIKKPVVDPDLRDLPLGDVPDLGVMAALPHRIERTVCI
jgi:hypothetical protein